MKKNGFTIAEILITLGIVGILAAISIPTFVSSQRKQTYAVALSAAISNFENAMTVMIMKDSAFDLFGTKAWRELGGSLSSSSTDATIKGFMANVGRVMPIDGYSKSYASFCPTITALDSNVKKSPNAFLDFKNKVVFKTKSGPAYIIYIADSAKDKDAKKEADALANGANLTAEAATVAIDVNGDKKPNMIGRDIYAFILGADGILYPYGGNDVTYKTTTSYTCATTDNGGVGCTATLMDNDYKMNY